MWLIKYECDRIKNMELLESLNNIQSKQTTLFTVLLPTMFYLIDKTMNLVISYECECIDHM